MSKAIKACKITLLDNGLGLKVFGSDKRKKKEGDEEELRWFTTT